MKLAVVIDPIEKLNPHKDSTIAMLQAASKYDIELYYMTQQDMVVEKGEPKATLTQIEVHPLSHDGQWYTKKQSNYQNLAELDVILMRKDPPFDLNYIYTTYLLELAEKKGVRVINRPQSLRDANEKYFTTHFPDCCPDTLISQDRQQLKNFWLNHQDVIYKPLEGMGGHSIFRVQPEGRNINVIIDLLTHNASQPIMAQQYLPEIKTKGDRRILIIDDYIVPYALARIPQGDDERGNLAQGAKGEVLPITAHEQQLAQRLIPTLQEKGLMFVGIDIIGNFITEINVTSPTCIVEIEQVAQLGIAERFIKKIIALNSKI